MTERELLHAIGNIDDSFIEEADRKDKKILRFPGRKIRQTAGAAVAALVLIAGAGVYMNQSYRKNLPVSSETMEEAAEDAVDMAQEAAVNTADMMQGAAEDTADDIMYEAEMAPEAEEGSAQAQQEAMKAEGAAAPEKPQEELSNTASAQEELSDTAAAEEKPQEEQQAAAAAEPAGSIRLSEYLPGILWKIFRFFFLFL